ncbi:MAG: ATP-dependent DNA helicase RecG [Alistipes sp.]|uniref:ATP-dependent DNA helicase RecG n=1 Tax=Alistipes sp. TaxID=1872444 RepID=UPI0025BAFDAB|nr:ATP-dependent DNA helicase RecG [Alistipes sp.]MCD8274653.1 ATP-dependent DNA helicase RecG [Alistipes sp.]
MEYLDNDIKYVGGVGEARARLLDRELGIRTLGDMLSHYPFRYIDRTKVYRIAEITEGAPTLLQFRARVTGVSYAGTGRKKRFTAHVQDPTGSAELVWFQGIKWIEKRVEVGREYLIFGRPSFYRGFLSMAHPELETMEQALSRKAESGMQGIYPSTEKLSNVLGAKGMYQIICNTWALVKDRIADYMPEAVRTRYGLIPLRDAYYNIHFPQSAELLRQAQYRLKFDELLGIQLNVQSRRTERLSKNNGFLFMKVGGVFNTFYNEKLPFPLTGAQKRVIREIRQDTVTGFQMNRLLQGDVGSGKTLVALMSMLLAVDNGFQACMMAPTEILARQHFATITRMLEDMDVKVAILTGASKAKERRLALEGIASGEVDILIGTHALIEDRVQFANLGFVVIDEQHRFGVEQRARLWTKNEQPPHILVMTATPIPRTLAMTLYGDLDVSVIDELPPGRRPIKTVHYTDAARLRLFGFMKQEIAKGRQVYVVYPLIKESEAMDYKDLTDGYEAISRDFPLPDYVTTICHGKMKPADKEESMRQFKSGEADIMVATSVIEVGVDVPNATVMVIESAERFGLSQLHQLRGRVGRGGEQSYCILMSGEKLSKESRARLQAMCETNDGFRLAELDLKLRGAGDINGTLQSGMAFDLKIANPTLDVQILTVSREAAAGILAADRDLSLPEHRGLRELRRKYSGEEELDFSMIS